MTNFSNTSSSPAEDNTVEHSLYALYIICIFLLCMCIIGLLGNGTVIYLLGFHIKRSPFVTYILNLAVADFGVLLFGSVLSILFLTSKTCSTLFDVVNIPATFMYVASQLLLTAISIDRCASVLFPIWYRCRRPTRWATVVCALMWFLACLPAGSCILLDILENGWNCRIGWKYIFFPFIVAALFCLPLVTVSAGILLFKVFCKSQQPQRRRLLTIVLLTLLFFLIFAFPLGAIHSLNYFNASKYRFLEGYGFICASLNSCVNPVIYYMVGRKKRAQRRETLKVMLQRVFKEEEEHRQEGSPAARM